MFVRYDWIVVLNDYQSALLALIQAVLDGHDPDLAKNIGAEAYARERKTVALDGVRGMGNTWLCERMPELLSPLKVLVVSDHIKPDKSHKPSASVAPEDIALIDVLVMDAGPKTYSRTNLLDRWYARGGGALTVIIR